MLKKLTRRDFMKKLISISLVSWGIWKFMNMFGNRKEAIAQTVSSTNTTTNKDNPMDNQDRDSISYIYESKNGTPEQNVQKVVEMMGGIEKFIGKEDIVILKPNAQWWNQGMTNTNAMKGFIELVLAIPGFKGEIIIAENHHCFGKRNTSNIRGWVTQERNGDFNLNELIEYFQCKGFRNVTKYHWVDVGLYFTDKTNMSKFLRPAKDLVKTIIGKSKGQLVSGPEDGDGYVWSNIEYCCEGRKTRMTYPIFTSSFSGVTIDFKNGAWKKGRYTQQPVKFINFAGLNYHSKPIGVTSSVKNYLGIVDLTAGPYDIKIEGYYNFHNIGFPAIGGAVGRFMNTIRKADLNIVTAEWVGFASRTDTRLSARPRTIIAGTDPVALDYYGAKKILYPLGGPVAEWNNPDNINGSLRKYLALCAVEMNGVLEETRMREFKFDYLV